jgi:hypothetical protein
MWGRKKPAVEQRAPEAAWDNKTQQYIADDDRLEVKVTSVVRRYGFGATEGGGAIREPNGYEIRGIMTFPKLIMVEFSFNNGEHQFGTWFYNVYNHSRAAGEDEKEVRLPFIEVHVSDADGSKRSAIYMSHMASLISGATYSTLRLWKKKGDGIFNEKDRAHGYSYSSRYDVLGMYVGGELESRRLPDWAVPYDSERFSLKNQPERWQLRL